MQAKASCSAVRGEVCTQWRRLVIASRIPVLPSLPIAFWRSEIEISRRIKAAGCETREAWRKYMDVGWRSWEEGEER